MCFSWICILFFLNLLWRLSWPGYRRSGGTPACCPTEACRGPRQSVWILHTWNWWGVTLPQICYMQLHPGIGDRQTTVLNFKFKTKIISSPAPCIQLCHIGFSQWWACTPCWGTSRSPTWKTSTLTFRSEWTQKVDIYSLIRTIVEGNLSYMIYPYI